MALRFLSKPLVASAFGLLAVVSAASLGTAAPERVSFDREVRAILSDNCFKCHGPDPKTRLAGLRLDTADGATRRLSSGRQAIVPGDPVASALLERIEKPHGDPAHMPPASTGKRVRPAQVETLRRWIAQGARYEEHWSFLPPRRPAVPKVAGTTHPVDAFLRAALRGTGLQPSPEADRRTLIRRVSLDLTGLPPTPAEIDAFLQDTRPGAYERVVDRLLASPHYGERMAIGWLDLARYADTHGYHIDSHRDMYRWRDWVIDAFNRNLPYDRFVTEQIAGDLLPDAGLEQRIATGFNRNHPINFEGGAIPEEYQTAYVADRVDTTATAFLGLTLRCAQCHDHKFDPFTQRDYYRFYAFFNNIDEQGLDGMTGNARPFLRAPYPGQEERLQELSATVARLDAQIAERERSAPPATRTAALAQEWDKALAPGLDLHLPLAALPDGATSTGKPTFVAGEPGTVAAFDGTSAIDLPAAGAYDPGQPFGYGAWVRLESTAANQTVLSRMDAPAGVRGWDLFVAAGGRPMAHFIHNWPDDALRVDSRETIPAGKWVHLFVGTDGTGRPEGVRLYIDGRRVATDIGMNTLRGPIATARPLRVGGRWPGTDLRGQVAGVRLYRGVPDEATVRLMAETDLLRPALAGAAASPEQQTRLTRHLLRATDPAYVAAIDAREAAKAERMALEKAIPTTMVMEERKGTQRATHILERGQYDRPTEKVEPGLPGTLAAGFPNGPADRRAVAAWLVSPRNPLVARVQVNRLWQHLFGTGLVATSENFGVQGAFPSHPALLDWLATEFVARGWDQKAMVRLIVTSAAYRQTSTPSPAARRIDPENRLLSHAPRLRLPAELIRDQALAASGLLVPTIGGPSVKIYQPAGLWEEMSFKGEFSAQYYEQDHGEKLYRRSLYTFWKRTVPPPSLQTFDAPEREFCIVRRASTNTPLQALVLMNDPTYVEASRKMAERLLREAPGSPTTIVTRLTTLVLGRPPRATELSALTALYNREASDLRRAPERAKRLLGVGESPADPRFDPVEVAAWASVVGAVLNLDEAVTRG